MEIKVVKTQKDKKAFIEFKRRLYENDQSYSITAEFVLNNVLNRTTTFIKSIFTMPILILDDEGNVCAECIFMHEPTLALLQVGFFEALDNKEAVDFLIQEAKTVARNRNLVRIIFGLNSHLSYGVGILTKGFEYKNSFDNIYNKDYYSKFFEGYETETLSTYKSNLENVRTLVERVCNLIDHSNSESITIRCADLKHHFTEEMEKLRQIINKTVGNTFLFTKTGPNHYKEILGSLKFYLNNENLIFAEDNGKPIGFVFWHPDFCQTLENGKYYNLLNIALKFNDKEKIDNIVLNSFGSQTPLATMKLLQALEAKIEPKYKTIETTFVWDNNTNSTLLNKRFFGSAYRKYNVYFLNV